MSGLPEELSFQARCSVPVTGFTANDVKLNVRMSPFRSGRNELPQLPNCPITGAKLLLVGGPNDCPPSSETREYTPSVCPAVQVMITSPFRPTATWHPVAFPKEKSMGCGSENVSPPSVERENRTRSCESPRSSQHAYTLPECGPVVRSTSIVSLS